LSFINIKIYVLIFINREIAEVEGSGQQEEVETESVYHFASYIPKNGFLWELDSLKLNATKLMAINDDNNWLELLQAFLQDKVETGNIEANLLAVVRDPLPEKETELATLIAQDEQLGNALNNEVLNPNEPSTSTAPISGSNLTSKGRKIQKEQNDLKKAIQKLQDDVATLREEGPAALMAMDTSASVEPPAETFTTKGKGKSRSVSIGPKIIRAAASMIQRGRGRGRGTRGRGSRGIRGRGSRGRGQTTGSSETPQDDTSSSGTKTSRKRRFDDADAEAARKANANKRYNFRK
jgi:hypothetical protein